MKLNTLHRTHPDIFCGLSLEQQEEMLIEDGFIVSLHHPLTNWKLSVQNVMQDVYSFHGLSAQIAASQLRTLIYWNDSQSVYIELK